MRFIFQTHRASNALIDFAFVSEELRMSVIYKVYSTEKSFVRQNWGNKKVNNNHSTRRCLASEDASTNIPNKII